MIQARPRLATLPACSLYLKPFGATNGTTFMDWSPSPKTITLAGDVVNSTTKTRFDPCSIYFDGNGDYLTVPNGAAFSGKTKFTLVTSVYVVGTGTQMIVSTDDGAGTTGNFSLYHDGTTLTFQYRDNPQWYFQNAMSRNAWHDIWIVSDGSNVTVYLDGGSIGTHAISNALGSTNPFTLGKSASGTAYYLTGYQDEVLFLNDFGAALETPRTCRFM